MHAANKHDNRDEHDDEASKCMNRRSDHMAFSSGFHHHHVRPDPRVVADFHVGANDGKRPDADVGAEFRLGIDERGRMDHGQT